MSASHKYIALHYENQQTGFFAVKDPLEIRRLLQKACDIESEAILQWKNDTSIRVKILSSSNPKRELHFLVSSEVGLDQKMNAIIYVNGQTLLCATLELLGKSENQLNFSIPKRLYKCQRRKEARMRISAAYPLQAEYLDLNEQPVRRKLLDLSPHGCSFQVVSVKDPKQYKVGTEINPFSIRVQGKELTCQAVIRSVTQLPVVPVPQGIQVGVEFLDLKPTDSELIFETIVQNIGHTLI